MIIIGETGGGSIIFISSKRYLLDEDLNIHSAIILVGFVTHMSNIEDRKKHPGSQPTLEKLSVCPSTFFYFIINEHSKLKKKSEGDLININELRKTSPCSFL